MVIELNAENYQKEVKDSRIPVFVKHYANWCGPCKLMAPVYEKLEQGFKGKAKLTQLNVDDNAVLAQQNNVRGIPALLFFRGGQEINRITGYQPEPVLKKKMEEFIATKGTI